MIRLMNSAMMPESGIYMSKRITQDEFMRQVRVAWGENNLDSYIGYPENRDLILRLTGIDLPINRMPVEIKTGDVMLCMRAKYVEPSEQRAKFRRTTKRTWEYFAVEYFAQVDAAAA